MVVAVLFEFVVELLSFLSVLLFFEADIAVFNKESFKLKTASANSLSEFDDGFDTVRSSLFDEGFDAERIPLFVVAFFHSIRICIISCPIICTIICSTI